MHEQRPCKSYYLAENLKYKGFNSNLPKRLVEWHRFYYLCYPYRKVKAKYLVANRMMQWYVFIKPSTRNILEIRKGEGPLFLLHYILTFNGYVP